MAAPHAGEIDWWELPPSDLVEATRPRPRCHRDCPLCDSDGYPALQPLASALDAADHPGAEIFLDPLNRRWRGSLEKCGSELDTVGAVVDPGAARPHELAGRDHRGVADNRDQVALPARFDTEDAEAVLGIMEGEALDETGQELGWRCRFGDLHHSRMMNRKVLRRYEIQRPHLIAAAEVTVS